MSNFKEPINAIKAERKRSKVTHPYAALEHRIIDSEAFADLKNSSVRLLMILIRQLTPYGNNGHLQATWKYCRTRGIGSEETLRGAIKDLIVHGLIHKTRSSGTHQQWARYAVTWLPIKDSRDLFLHTFRMNAWKDWVPEKNSSPNKPMEMSPKYHRIQPEIPSVSEGLAPQKIDDYELVPSRGLTGASLTSELNSRGTG